MSEETFEIRWNVRNLDLLWQEKISLISPTVDVEDVHCHKRRLILTPIIEPETEETLARIEKAKKKKYFSLYLQNFDLDVCGASGSIFHSTFSLIHPIQGEILSQGKIQFDGCSKNLFGFQKFISMEKLKECRLDKFTILCKGQGIKQDFNKFAYFFLDQDTCSDVNLVVGVNEIQGFPAHKIVLALGSEYFQQKFADDESASFLKIENTRREVVIEILRYMYTGEAIFSEKLVYELLEAAFYYKAFGLLTKCEEFLTPNLTIGNVVRTLLSCRSELGNFYDRCCELITECMFLIDEHLDEVIKLDLCKELLEKEPRLLTEIVVFLCINQPISYIINETCECKCCKRKSEESCCSQTYKKRFKRFAKSSDFSDIEIHVSDLKYAAHKLILAARSPVFERMFSHNMKETISGVMTIEDIRPQVFEEVLKFLYTDQLESEDDLIQEILIVSDKYEIKDLKWKCENILEENLTGDNVITTLIFADNYNAKRLKKTCLRFITNKDYFWGSSSYYFTPKRSILNENLAKSHPHLLYEILKEIHQNKLS